MQVLASHPAVAGWMDGRRKTQSMYPVSGVTFRSRYLETTTAPVGCFCALPTRAVMYASPIHRDLCPRPLHDGYLVNSSNHRGKDHPRRRRRGRPNATDEDLPKQDLPVELWLAVWPAKFGGPVAIHEFFSNAPFKQPATRNTNDKD